MPMTRLPVWPSNTNRVLSFFFVCSRIFLEKSWVNFQPRNGKTNWSNRAGVMHILTHFFDSIFRKLSPAGLEKIDQWKSVTVLLCLSLINKLIHSRFYHSLPTLYSTSSPQLCGVEYDLVNARLNQLSFHSPTAEHRAFAYSHWEPFQVCLLSMLLFFLPFHIPHSGYCNKPTEVGENPADWLTKLQSCDSFVHFSPQTFFFVI